MVNKDTSGIAGRIQRILLIALAFVLLVPGLARADATIDTLTTKDLDVDGRLDQLIATFSEPPTTDAADYVITDGYQIDSALGITLSGNTATINLVEKTSFDTDATPTLTYQGASTKIATDNASPVLVEAVGDDYGTLNLFNATGDKMWLVFSERVALFNAGSAVPAQTAADKHLALEQAIVIGGICNDGNGVASPAGSSNFPTASPFGTTGTTDPISEGFGTPAAVEGTRTITITQNEGNSGSNNTNPSKQIAIFPAADNPPCTAGITADPQMRNLKGKAANGEWTVPVVVPGAGTAKVTHIRQLTNGAPTTESASHDGQVDQISITFKHAVDAASATVAALNRFTISDGAVTVPTSGLSFPADPVSGTENKILTLNFTPPSGWHTGTTPLVTYTDSGACQADGIMVFTAGNFFKECAAAFSLTASDKAKPVVLGAKTLDANTNGKIDGVRLRFSELMDEDSLPGDGAGFNVAGYTPNATSTPSGGDDVDVDVIFAENSTDGDTAATPAVTYTPGTVKDVPGNLLDPITTAVTPADGAGAVIMAGSVYDVMKGSTANLVDGRIDEAVISFSEPVDDSSLALDKLTIGGAAATVFKTSPINQEDAGVADDNVVTVAVGAGVAGTDAKEIAAVAGAVSDLAAVPVAAPASTLAAGSVADKAGPLVMTVTPTGQSTTSVLVQVTYSEAMKSDSSLAMSFSDGVAAPTAIPADISAGHTNGWRTDDARIWDGAAEAPAPGACDVVSGCAYVLTISNGEAAGGTVTEPSIEPDTRFPWTIDSIAPQAPAITAPGSGQQLTTTGSTGTVTVNGTAGEPALTVEIREGETLLGTATTAAGAGSPWSRQLTNVPLGAHTITVLAKDAGGNVSSSVIRSFTLKQATSLVMARSASIVVYGHGTLTISGTLKNAAGQGIANVPVVVQGQTYGQSIWHNLATVTTSSSGGYAWATKPAASTTYRTVYAGTPTVASSISNAIGVPVRAILTASQSATRIRLGSTWAVGGAVRPAHPGKYVRVMQWTSYGWKTVAFARLDAASNYRFAVRPGARGTYTYRFWYYKQDLEHFDYWQDRKVSVV